MDSIVFTTRLSKFFKMNPPQPLPSNTLLYSALIKDLIEELNKAKGNPEEKATILQQLKEADKAYLDVQGIAITRQVLFMRHAKCSAIDDKALGLEPNTAANDAALANMEKTHQYTASLLLNPFEPIVVISPLVRALQTAAKVVPRDGNATVTIDPALAENGGAPSSTDARNRNQLTNVMNEIPLFSMKEQSWELPVLAQKPLRKVLSWLNSPMDDDETLELSWKIPVASIPKALLLVSSLRQTDYIGLAKKRNNAIDSLLEASNGCNGGITAGAKNSSSYRNNHITKEEKIERIYELIQSEEINEQIPSKGFNALTRELNALDKRNNDLAKLNDLMLIGHGSNFKSFFKVTFGNDSSFAYCESRKVYVVQDLSEHNKSKLFSPCYTLTINQKTGEIEGTHTDKIAFGESKRIEEQEEISDEWQQQPQPQPSSSSSSSYLFSPRNTLKTNQQTGGIDTAVLRSGRIGEQKASAEISGDQQQQPQPQASSSVLNNGSQSSIAKRPFFGREKQRHRPEKKRPDAAPIIDDDQKQPTQS